MAVGTYQSQNCAYMKYWDRIGIRIVFTAVAYPVPLGTEVISILWERK